MSERLDIVMAGLSITSSWGNGHATTYRALVDALGRRGHRVLFLERDVPWYAQNRDAPNPAGCELGLYDSIDELSDRFAARVEVADLVIVGSYVPEGAVVCDWVLDVARNLTAFYDIDTPVTLRLLETGGAHYLDPNLIERFDAYLSFSGGPVLERLERRYGARVALPFYCSVDPSLYRPLACRQRWALGYLGTYSADRQDALERLLAAPARRRPDERFVVAGSQYPDRIRFPDNVDRVEHVPPDEHAAFYRASRFSLNVTRGDMVSVGHAPSVRLFEAAACAAPIISDRWPGIERFFEPGLEILLADDTEGCLEHLERISDDTARAIGERARRRVLAEHTAERRATQLEGYVRRLREARRAPRAGTAGKAAEIS